MAPHGPLSPLRCALAALLLVLPVALPSAPAWADCNVIPAATGDG